MKTCGFLLVLRLFIEIKYLLLKCYSRKKKWLTKNNNLAGYLLKLYTK